MSNGQTKIVVVQSSETRIDILSKRIYGTTNNVRRLLKSNPHLNVFDIKAGLTIKAPNNG